MVGWPEFYSVVKLDQRLFQYFPANLRCVIQNFRLPSCVELGCGFLEAPGVSGKPPRIRRRECGVKNN
jgi:hypothetical protein